MALDAISSGGYRDVARPVQKPVADVSNTMSIKVNEVPTTTKPVKNQTEWEQEKGTRDSSASEQQIKDAISKANTKLRTHRTSIEFSYHEETKRVSIKVTDKETKEVIREIPPEETLEMIQKMWELAGILVDEKR